MKTKFYKVILLPASPLFKTVTLGYFPNWEEAKLYIKYKNMDYLFYYDYFNQDLIHRENRYRTKIVEVEFEEIKEVE